MSLDQPGPTMPPTEPASNSVRDSSTTDGSTQRDSQPAVMASAAGQGDELELKGLGTAESAVSSRPNELQQKVARQAEDAQRSAFAAATLKAFKNKLAGCDISTSEADAVSSDVPVEKHVDQLIKQATSLTNLCRMYEGWTAWI